MKKLVSIIICMFGILSINLHGADTATALGEQAIREAAVQAAADAPEVGRLAAGAVTQAGEATGAAASAIAQNIPDWRYHAQELSKAASAGVQSTLGRRDVQTGIGALTLLYLIASPGYDRWRISRLRPLQNILDELATSSYTIESGKYNLNTIKNSLQNTLKKLAKIESGNYYAQYLINTWTNIPAQLNPIQRAITTAKEIVGHYLPQLMKVRAELQGVKNAFEHLNINERPAQNILIDKALAQANNILKTYSSINPYRYTLNGKIQELTKIKNREDKQPALPIIQDLISNWTQ